MAPFLASTVGGDFAVYAVGSWIFTAGLAGDVDSREPNQGLLFYGANLVDPRTQVFHPTLLRF
jgi:hypothetical protein